jgi:hypothetical protein
VESASGLVRLGSGPSRSLPVPVVNGALLVDCTAAGVCFGRPGLSAVCWFGFRNNSCLIIFRSGTWSGFCLITGAKAPLHDRLEVDLRHACRGAGLHRGANLCAVDVPDRRSGTRFTAAKIIGTTSWWRSTPDTTGTCGRPQTPCWSGSRDPRSQARCALSLSKGASHTFIFLILVADPEHPPALCSALPEAADLRFAISGHSPVMTARVLRSSLIDFLSRGGSTPCAGGAFLCAPR